MAIDSTKKSSRFLQGRRYTHDTFTDAQEAFTSVLDINANEVYTDQALIPSSSLPFSGSAQSGSIYSVGGQNVMKYWYRQKMTKSNLNNEVWFFLDPTGSASGIGAQLIDTNQQTNFISPKYSVSSLTNANTEDAPPGYGVKVLVDSTQQSANNYAFDYKTGVLEFSSSAVAPTAGQLVYITAYQYVGRTLSNYTASLATSASYALTASFALNAGGSTINTGSFATTGSNIFRGNQTITGSINLTGSIITNTDLPIQISSTNQVGSLVFEGTSSLAMSPGIIVGSGSYTAESFIYINDYNNRNVIFAATTPGGAGFSFGTLSVNQIFTDRDGVSANVYEFASNFPTNQWFHVAVTRNSGGQETVFVSGVKSTSAYGTNVNYSGITDAIGKFNEGVWIIRGRVSQARLVVGSNVYDPTSSTITVPTSSLTNITNTKVLLNVTSAGTYLNDTSGNQTITNSGSVTFNSSGPVSSSLSTVEFLFKSNGDLTIPGNVIASGAVSASAFTGSLSGTSSFANNATSASYALTASYALFAANGGNSSTNQITTGSITASVDVSPNNLFLIKSGSNVYFNISSSSNTTLSSDLFIIKNFTTQQPVLTISQSVVQFATQSTIPTGTTQAGSIWFTSSSLYIGLE
jgi:hypothetical protein